VKLKHEKFVFTAQVALKGRYVCYYTRLLGSCYKTSGIHRLKIVNVKGEPLQLEWGYYLKSARVFPSNILVSRSFHTHSERSFHLSFTVLVHYGYLTRYLAFGAIYLQYLKSNYKDFYSILRGSCLCKIIPQLERCDYGADTLYRLVRNWPFKGRSSHQHQKEAPKRDPERKSQRLLVHLRSPLLVES